ncbi:hypothetical protein BRC99_02230 [Halobacteriales archaeon QS_7_69_60]|nr:MAG: hypothetical protein BRC99_02230 [Halobacteriales archaeon QS_7_69_60]
MFTYPNSDPVTPTNSLADGEGAVVVARRSGRALAARLARDADRVRELPLPGVGTVRFTVEPR